MQVKSITDCSKGSILQYFRPALTYHLSLRSLFCLFLSGPFRQVLLYFQKEIQAAIKSTEQAVHTSQNYQGLVPIIFGPPPEKMVLII